LSSAGPTPISDGFRQGLRELGWVDGQNIAVDYRFAEKQRIANTKHPPATVAPRLVPVAAT